MGFLKGIIAFLLLMPVAVTSYSGDGSVDSASVEKEIYVQNNHAILPPVVTEKYEYYDVKGNDEEMLRCDISKNGCKWRDGKIYDSVTTWRIKQQYDCERGPQTCSAESFKATIDIIFRYPKWVRNDSASKPLVEKWDRYLKNLITHENGHRDMAVHAAEELSRAVAALPPASNCAELDRSVRALYNEHMQKLRETEQKYDAATNHGLTQGAVFP